MNSIQTRGHVVEALREWDGSPTYTAEQRILIAAAQIIRSCTMDELLAISVTTAATGDLWGARAMADAEIARREFNAGTHHDSKRGTPSRSRGTPADSEPAP